MTVTATMTKENIDQQLKMQKRQREQERQLQQHYEFVWQTNWIKWQQKTIPEKLSIFEQKRTKTKKMTEKGIWQRIRLNWTRILFCISFSTVNFCFRLLCVCTHQTLVNLIHSYTDNINGGNISDKMRYRENKGKRRRNDDFDRWFLRFVDGICRRMDGKKSEKQRRTESNIDLMIENWRTNDKNGQNVMRKQQRNVQCVASLLFARHVFFFFGRCHCSFNVYANDILLTFCYSCLLEHTNTGVLSCTQIVFDLHAYQCE